MKHIPDQPSLPNFTAGEVTQAAVDMPGLIAAIVPAEFQATTANLLEKGGWQTMAPNNPHETHLEPQNLTPETMMNIMAALGNEPVEASEDGIRVGTLGQLSPIGKGDNKTGYLFTDASGKKMHVLVQDGGNLPPQLQSDPHIFIHTQSKRSRGVQTVGPQEYGTYSAPRTYLTLVMAGKDGPMSVHFQEFGGVSKGVRGELNPIRKGLAQGRAVRHIREKGFDLLYPDDFKKPDHYLWAPNGKPGFIDISVIRPLPGTHQSTTTGKFIQL